MQLVEPFAYDNMSANQRGKVIKNTYTGISCHVCGRNRLTGVYERMNKGWVITRVKSKGSLKTGIRENDSTRLGSGANEKTSGSSVTRELMKGKHFANCCTK